MRASLKPNKSLKVPIFFLRLLGAWKVNGKLEKIYRAYGFIIYSFTTYIYATFELLSIIRAWGNIPEMADGIYLMITIICLTFKVGVLNPNKMKRTVDLLNEKKLTQHSLNQDHIVDNCMKTANRNAVAILTLCSLTCASWNLGPILTGATKYRKLPVKAWYPIPYEETPYYQIVYAYQFFGIWFGALVNCSIDGLVAGLMVLTCAQLRVLKYSLRNVRSTAIDNLRRKQDQELCKAFSQPAHENWKCDEKEHLQQNDKLLEEETFKEMTKCIQHHCAVVRLVRSIEGTFTVSMFFQFVGSTLVICIVAFEVSFVKPFSPQFFTIFMYMVNMIIQIFFYCWYGNEVFLESLAINDFIYECDWYRCGPRVTKLIITMMERCKKPLTLTAGKFFFLSLETFTSILRSAYSFYAVLQQMDYDIDLEITED